MFEQIDVLLREADGGRIEVSGVMPSAHTRPGHGDGLPKIGFNSRSMGSEPQALPPVPQLVLPTRASAFPPSHGRDPNDLRAWSFRLVTPGNSGAHVRDATFSPDLREILTLGNAGLVQWSASGWTAVPLAIGLAPQELRALTHVGNGVQAVAGEVGLIAILQNGSWEVRRYPDPDIAFHGIGASPTGQVMWAVGARTSRGTAVMVEVLSTGFRRTFEIPDMGPLRSVCYLDERTAFACGEGGALVRVDDAGLTRIAWERSGHLRMIVASAGVYAVGTGGHALSISTSATGRTEIEKVNTTQDLLGVAVAPDGAAWACSANARLLRRDSARAWRRIPAELPVPTNLVRVAPRHDRVMIVSEDAAVIEGILS